MARQRRLNTISDDEWENRARTLGIWPGYWAIFTELGDFNSGDFTRSFYTYNRQTSKTYRWTVRQIVKSGKIRFHTTGEPVYYALIQSGHVEKWVHRPGRSSIEPAASRSWSASHLRGTTRFTIGTWGDEPIGGWVEDSHDY